MESDPGGSEVRGRRGRAHGDGRRAGRARRRGSWARGARVPRGPPSGGRGGRSEYSVRRLGEWTCRRSTDGRWLWLLSGPQGWSLGRSGPNPHLGPPGPPGRTAITGRSRGRGGRAAPLTRHVNGCSTLSALARGPPGSVTEAPTSLLSLWTSRSVTSRGASRASAPSHSRAVPHSPARVCLPAERDVAPQRNR